jgi:methylglyoxal synthase
MYDLSHTGSILPGRELIWIMEHDIICMDTRKRIALVAHDNKKQDLLEWARFNRDLLVEHELYATGTTGKLLEAVLETHINKLQSGPLGGDQQIGAKIAEGNVDFMIFFWDPLEPQPHDTDVKALLRIAVVWNIPVACDRASADFMISSTLMSTPYERLVPVYAGYRERVVAGVDNVAGVAVVVDAEGAKLVPALNLIAALSLTSDSAS